MDNRLEDIDFFLKDAAEYYSECSEDFDYRIVYNALTVFNLSDYDMEEGFFEKKDFELFEKWALDAGKNFEVKKSKANSYFWLFCNPMLTEYESKHRNKIPIKLYIPVGKNTFENVLPDLFKFLSDNNIMHISKISADVRTDDIVVRVYKISEAEQLIKYVNEKFQDEILETNPFVLRDGIVGIAADGDHSYNIDVAIHIAEFIKQTDTENVSIDSFKRFIQDNLKDFSGEDKMIMNILLLALDNKTNMKDFYEYWDIVTDIPKGAEGDEVSYSNKSYDKYDSFDKKVESKEYAIGLEARRKQEKRAKYISNLRELNGGFDDGVFLKPQANEELKEIDDNEER